MYHGLTFHLDKEYKTIQDELICFNGENFIERIEKLHEILRVHNGKLCVETNVKALYRVWFDIRCVGVIKSSSQSRDARIRACFLLSRLERIVKVIDRKSYRLREREGGRGR